MPAELLSVIMDEYLENTNDPAVLQDGFLELLGDFIIVIPSIKALSYYWGETMNTLFKTVSKQDTQTFHYRLN